MTTLLQPPTKGMLAYEKAKEASNDKNTLADQWRSQP